MPIITILVIVVIPTIVGLAINARAFRRKDLSKKEKKKEFLKRTGVDAVRKFTPGIIPSFIVDALAARWWQKREEDDRKNI